MPLGHAGSEIHLHTGAPALTPLYGILLLVMLNSRDARGWAARGVAGASATVPERTSGMAVASFALSLIPFAGITQLVGLILGIVALTQIRASRGKLGGRGFAIAGVAIASTIFLFLVGILVLVLASSTSSHRPEP